MFQKSETLDKRRPGWTPWSAPATIIQIIPLNIKFGNEWYWNWITYFTNVNQHFLLVNEIEFKLVILQWMELLWLGTRFGRVFIPVISHFSSLDTMELLSMVMKNSIDYLEKDIKSTTCTDCSETKAATHTKSMSKQHSKVKPVSFPISLNDCVFWIR